MKNILKFTTLITTLFLLGFSNLKETANDFDYKLTQITNKFRQEIMDKSECENQKREITYLAKDIEIVIKNNDGYTSDEINKLKILKNEAEALEQYIAVIGNCGNDILSIENFYLINKKVGGNISSFANKKFCVDVISVTIGDYVIYLVENNNQSNYTVTYKWRKKLVNGMNSASGEMGLSKESLHHIYDNRKLPTQKSITVYEITCKEF